MKYLQKYKLFESFAAAKKYEDELEDKGLDLYTLARLDTSSNHKYLPMICRYALDGVELDDINDYVKAFDMLVVKDKIKNKDIFSYKEFNALKDIVDVVDMKSKGDLVGEIRKERKMILDNEDFLIFIPSSHRASVKYGMGTKWCISMKDDPFMWYAITNSNALFYFVIVIFSFILGKNNSLFLILTSILAKNIEFKLDEYFGNPLQPRLKNNLNALSDLIIISCKDLFGISLNSGIFFLISTNSFF